MYKLCCFAINVVFIIISEASFSTKLHNTGKNILLQYFDIARNNLGGGGRGILSFIIIASSEYTQ